MNQKVRKLRQQTAELEEDLRAGLREQEVRLAEQLSQIREKRIEFENAVRERHRKLKMGVFRWLATVRPQNFVTMPIISISNISMSLSGFTASIVPGLWRGAW